MIDKICMFLTNKIRKEMPEVDDERAEVINYGLQNIIGEVPKIFILLAVSYFLGVFTETLITFATLLIYRAATGGFHLHTHLGCIISTCVIYCGIAFISKYIVMEDFIRYIVIGCVWIFGIIMIKLYAPADTENVPILRKKDRLKKRIVAYIALTIAMIVAVIIPDNTISNILIYGHFVQTLMITRLAYIITKNKYGFEVYQNTSKETV